MAASRSLAARYTRCCRIGSIAARSSIRSLAHPGEHPAIVDEALWRQVQEKLEANGVERSGARNAIAGRRAEPFNFRGGLRIQTLVETIQESSRAGAWKEVV